MSLNPTCPVYMHELVSGADDFDIDDQGTSFRVTEMDEENFEWDYDYTVKATAVGGATGLADGWLSVQSVCLGQL